MDPHLEDTLCISVRSQSGAACKLFLSQRKYGPVLDLMSGHQLDLTPEPRPNLILCERSTDKQRYLRISPEHHGQGRVAFVPLAESKAIRRQKITTSATH